MCGCAHFLSLIDGPEVKGLIERLYDWLHNVESGKSPLLFDRMAWGVLEADFKRAFVDYTKQERAHNEMKKLRMIDGVVNEYIASFESLGHHAGVDLNDPSN